MYLFLLLKELWVANVRMTKNHFKVVQVFVNRPLFQYCEVVFLLKTFQFKKVSIHRLREKRMATHFVTSKLNGPLQFRFRTSHLASTEKASIAMRSLYRVKFDSTKTDFRIEQIRSEQNYIRTTGSEGFRILELC